jgi:hypothetical protein
VDHDDELFAGILRWERTWQLMLVISPRWRAAQAHRSRRPIKSQGVKALAALVEGDLDDADSNESEASLARSLGVTATDLVDARIIAKWTPEAVEGVLSGASFAHALNLAKKRRDENTRIAVDDLADAG